MNRILTPFEQALKSAEIDARARKALEPLWNRVSGTLICSTCKQILGNYGVEDENEINYYATPAGKAHIMERKCESGQHPAQVEYTISPTIPQLPPFPYDFTDPRTIQEQYDAWKARPKTPQPMFKTHR